MKYNVLAAAIIAIGLIVGSFMIGGRYTFADLDGNTVARMDRFTGKVDMCIPGTPEECSWMLDSQARLPDSRNNSS